MNTEYLQKQSLAEQEAITTHIQSLITIVETIKTFDKKVVNKRMIDAIKATGTYVSWSDDYAGRKEMKLHLGYQKNAQAYPNYFREFHVPLVLIEGRLQYAETKEALLEKINMLHEKFDAYNFDLDRFELAVQHIQNVLKEAYTLRDEFKNQYAKEVISQLLRRGY